MNLEVTVDGNLANERGVPVKHRVIPVYDVRTKHPTYLPLRDQILIQAPRAKLSVRTQISSYPESVTLDRLGFQVQGYTLSLIEVGKGQSLESTRDL